MQTASPASEIRVYPLCSFCAAPRCLTLPAARPENTTRPAPCLSSSVPRRLIPHCRTPPAAAEPSIARGRPVGGTVVVVVVVVARAVEPAARARRRARAVAHGRVQVERRCGRRRRHKDATGGAGVDEHVVHEQLDAGAPAVDADGLLCRGGPGGNGDFG